VGDSADDMGALGDEPGSHGYRARSRPGIHRWTSQ